jgi:hypothetical protein
MLEISMACEYQRTLLLSTEENRFYWKSGQDDILPMLHCQDCGYWCTRHDQFASDAIAGI